MSVLIEQGHVTEYPLNHARILYGNVITDAEATGELPRYPAAAVLTETTYERWSPSVSGDSLTLSFPEQEVNALALAALSGLDFEIEVREGGTWVAVSLYPPHGPSLAADFAEQEYGLLDTSPDNQATLLLLKPRTIDAARITVTYAATSPTIGVVRVGTLLEMMRPFYQGHTPAILAGDNTLTPNISESGEWLGASLLRQGRSINMKWENLKASWVRRKWYPFSKTIKTAPFIVAWNAKQYSADVFYCSASSTPKPTHTGPLDYMSISLSARGYSDGTDPEVLFDVPNSTFSEMFDLSRATASDYIASDGTVTPSVSGEPRFTHDPQTGERLGLLVGLDATLQNDVTETVKLRESLQYFNPQGGRYEVNGYFHQGDPILFSAENAMIRANRGGWQTVTTGYVNSSFDNDVRLGAGITASLEYMQGSMGAPALNTSEFLDLAIQELPNAI